MTRFKISADPRQRGKLRAKQGLETTTLPASGYSLEGVPIFGNLPPAVRRRIEKNCRWREADAGERVIVRGQRDKDVYLLVSGTAHVLNFAYSGRVVDYESLEPGDLFGELSAIDGMPRSASVMTRTPCQMAVLDGELFSELLDGSREFNRLVLRRLTDVVRNGTEKIAELTLLGGKQRVCLQLLRMAQPDPAQMHLLMIYPAPNQALIAQGTGVSRETVARLFGNLARQSIIERKDKTLYIRDRGRLEELAMSGDDVATH
jgi:CRP-like cAMP-binding protein